MYLHQTVKNATSQTEWLLNESLSFKLVSMCSKSKSLKRIQGIKTPSGLNLVTHVSLGLKVSLKQDIQPAVSLTALQHLTGEWLCIASKIGCEVGTDRPKPTPIPAPSPTSAAVYLRGLKLNAVSNSVFILLTFSFLTLNVSRNDSLTPLWQQKYQNRDQQSTGLYSFKVDSNNMVFKCSIWFHPPRCV